MHTLFLTGATGFIGKALLEKCLATDYRIIVLVRSLQRWKEWKTLQKWKDSSSILAIKGDLGLPHLGLSNEDWELAMEADTIIHAGGPMDILLHSDQAYSAFMQGAIHIAELASEIHQAHSLKQFIHIVGYKSPVTEEHIQFPERLDQLLQHEASYEQMKFKADAYIRQQSLQHRFPLSIIHPGVVIGDSITGTTPQLGGLGIVVDAVRKGKMRIVPGGKRHWLPLVHVDYIADFLICLLLEEQHSQLPHMQAYYLLNRPEHTYNIKQLVKQISLELNAPQPILSVPPYVAKYILSTSLGQKLGVPAASIGFIVEQQYPLESVRQIEAKYGIQSTITVNGLQKVIQDLDARLQLQTHV
ncbi:SDR family oxidoreductase [Paenibacillus nuruki]|uniref:SDR family oxidoreductase n=1 Tax=Paenibacillus nuruki TaxID=1886670 RepID=UPI0028043F62|nr:SDR family oxidoreductase [Paenibacillus nuruki]CAJ1316221.1 Thioester reductase (TE) domain-containing protein [Paenibacillus nuruki]